MTVKKIFFNRYFDKNRLKALILWSLTKSGEKTTIDLVEKLKDLGFHYATQAGLSLGIDDLKIPPTKAELILEAELTVQASQRDYEIGNVTIIEKFQQLIDVWHRTSEILKQNVVQHFRSTDILNPVYMMAFSGARGNISQVRQLVGMRGLMADPQGQILDFPIRSNFREGLTLTEYVISCYGARKGLVDTALRTANSGYLTRRLVDVAQHIIVRQLDCGTTNGIYITDMKDGKKVIFSLQKRLIGRVLAEPIEQIAKRNQDISPALALQISKLRNQVLVRSPLSCEAKNSICQLCYGWSLAHGNLVSLGEAVGILAAQSIGEPGTQLTMRTFHTGGVFSGDVMQEIRSPFNGKIIFKEPLQGILIRTLHGKIAFLTKTEGEFAVWNEQNSTKLNFNIPNSTVIFTRQGEKVCERQLLAEYSSFVATNNQGIQAKFNLNSNIEGQIYYENVLLVVKNRKEGDTLKTALKFGSLWILAGKLYESSFGSNLYIKPNDLVDTRSIINESIFISPYAGYLFKNSSTQTKRIFITKKSLQTSTNQDLIKQFLTNQRLLSNENSFYKTQNFPIQKELNFNQKFLNISTKRIQYKKLGYFISLKNNSDTQLFLGNSLRHNQFSINSFVLNWYLKKDLQQKGLVVFDTNFFFDQKGLIFVKPEKIYKIPLPYFKNISNSSNVNRKKSIENFISIKNKQGINSKILIRKYSSIDYANKLETQNLRKYPTTNNKDYYSFRKNPSSSLLKNFNEAKNSLKYNREIKKSSHATYRFWEKNKFRKNNINEQTVNKLSQVLTKNQEKQIVFNKSSLNLSKISKIEKFYINSGWKYIPNNVSELLLLNNFFYSPTYQIVNYQFDQNYTFFEKENYNKQIFYFLKTYKIQRIRFIKNQLFRYNILHFNKKQIKVNSFFTKSQFQKQELTFSFQSILNSSIKRNNLYKKNWTTKKPFLLTSKKLFQSKKLTNLEQKRKFQNIIADDKKFYYLNVNSFSSNKQKTTRLKLPVSAIDIKLQNPKYSSFKKVKKLHPIKISFSAFQKNFFQTTSLNLQLTKNLTFAITQKIESINYLFDQTKTKNQILLTSNNEILQQTNFLKNSFFSPHSGEITILRKDVIGKEKSLIVTTRDQLMFSTNQQKPLIKIGQLVRYGDEIFKGIASTESGQIIQIDKNKITLRKAQPILFSSQGVFHVDNGDIIEKNTPVITLFYQKLKTEDIVQGIPKIEELFEARQTKEGETLQENLHTKLTIFFNYYKQHYTSQEAARKSIEKIQQILVNNVQKVYQSQGVSIADKHIEIIVRQMTTKVKITESGRTGLLRGELIDLEWVEVINLGIEAQNELTNQGIEVEKAEYEPIILGITKAALETESFISASSFQETTRILSRAAIERKTDFLRGLKENVILGHLIPAGTGFTLSFDSQIKVSTNSKKISSLSYKEIFQTFSKTKK